MRKGQALTGQGTSDIVIRGAREHNLQGFDLVLPQGRLIVVTGVSGSGKSSLAFDTLFREGQRRFLETLPAFARTFAGGFRRPQVTSIRGLGPAVAVGQRQGLTNPRSTVGTLTEVWDHLRLLFARLGSREGGGPLTRGLFSFNGPDGACPQCQGLGVEDRLDLDLLVADPSRSLREGALRVSTPNGYLMYSQVTLEVLDQVLRAHGGSVDLPWQDLDAEVRRVVLYGSERLQVPYGKHPLESRLQWTGITARPRPDGFYRGLVPVMEGILRGKRNDSILRFVRSAPCGACQGARLRPEALAVRWEGRGIDAFAAMTASQLHRCLAEVAVEGRQAPVLAPIRAELLARCELMEELGLGYLTFDRGAPTLSQGESQRLRLLGLALGELQGLLVVLDEPTAGLHPREVERLLRVLRRLRDQGQTVVVVEHDPVVAGGADWLVELGPGPGALGGRVLYSGPPSQRVSPAEAPAPARRPRPGTGAVHLEGLRRHNLQGVALDLKVQALNVVTGVSGSGKTSLLTEAVARLQGEGQPFARLITVGAEPIGRTPRSNAATYSGAFDLIRNLFAATPQARALGLGKGMFTFNTAGGRCETCEGAGVLEVGMRHLGTVTIPCEACQGRRFHEDVLKVRYRGRSIADVLEGSLAEAAACFADQPALHRILSALLDCGLGYLTLGQPATTLSGGEAVRVKLATELARAALAPALITLDEPTVGLHATDVAVLLAAWDRLLAAGHTLLVADNASEVVRAADHLVELGPGSGPEGGRVVAAGSLEAVVACEASLTGACLRAAAGLPEPVEPPRARGDQPMAFRSVTTHNLQSLDVAIPARGFTVVTGPSGCGKSSLVFDTLLAEAQNRFADLVAPWARRLLPRRGGVEFVSATGLRATVAVSQGQGRRNPRSRVGTVTGLDELLRLLFARAGLRPEAASEPLPALLASSFSPNAEAGGCPGCKGLGFSQSCAPELLVTHPGRALDEGALDGTAFGAYLGEPDGQYLATLKAAGQALGLAVDGPWRDLAPAAQQLAMQGAGDQVFEVAWRYRRGKAEGIHRLSTPWAGLATLVDREYERLHLDVRGEALEGLLAERTCPQCQGERLKAPARAVRYRGLRFPEVVAMPVAQVLAWLAQAPPEPLTATLIAELLPRLEALDHAGLGYLALDRGMASLSGGEAQRVRLAAALEGGLSGVAYVLDEPTQGLHPRDGERLAGVLRALCDAGNAVVVVEHDPGLIARADLVLELGPGAGPAGGRLMACGSPEAMRADPASYTGRLLAQPGLDLTAPASGPGRRAGRPGVTLRGVTFRNLRQLDVTLPLGALVAVTGVSGSGKSTLVQEVLGASLQARLQGRGPVGCASLELAEPLRAVLALGQGALAAAGHSTVATLTGVGEALRKRFAATPRAKAHKLTARHFSTAVPGGRCEACEGRGVLTIALDLLPEVVIGCEACLGQRFLAPVLECQVEGLTIAQALEAEVAQLAQVFAGEARLADPLRALVATGLGYLRLGQEAQALSEGEAVRLRLAGLLATPLPGPSAILLDEPSRGLGAGEVERLLAVLGRLAEAGHLVVAVEHDLRFIAASDWVVDLGPEGGPGGGTLVAEGPPELIAACPASHTGRALSIRV